MPIRSSTAHAIPIVVLCGGAISVPAAAQNPAGLPAPVKALFDEAMKGDDQAAFDSLARLALKTNPEDKAEIEALQKAYKDRQTQRVAEKKAADDDRIRTAGLAQLWAGSVEAGGFRNTGNTKNIGLSAAVKLDRKGLRWEHIVQANADYQRDDHVVTKSQYSASYQAQFTLSPRLFVYGHGLYERDPLSGYDSRYTLSSGIGYHFIQRKDLTLSAEFGPAARWTDFVDEPSETSYSVATSADLAWQINNRIRLLEKASSYVGSDDDTFQSETGLETGLSSRLSFKLSYVWKHETHPAEDALKTDTITRFTLAYKLGTIAAALPH